MLGRGSDFVVIHRTHKATNTAEKKIYRDFKFCVLGKGAKREVEISGRPGKI